MVSRGQAGGETRTQGPTISSSQHQLRSHVCQGGPRLTLMTSGRDKRSTRNSSFHCEESFVEATAAVINDMH